MWNPWEETHEKPEMEEIYPISHVDCEDSLGNMTVEKEVNRGKKLRAQKPSSRMKLNREINVVNIDFIRPHNCSPNYKDHIRQRKDPRKSYLTTLECPLKCECNSWQRKTPRKYRRNTTMQRTLSMRIAELAVPSKRQCLDTWRNKSYILPAHMIDRLKQYVTDQQPVVQIHDAINCFKKRKSTSSKRSSSITTPKPLKLMKLKYLCALFGYKISKQLLPPMCISLGSSLDGITQVVANDIVNILDPKPDIDNVKIKSIHMEMTSKIVNWIESILEDASHKLLLESLQDLEDEVGPVLDFIDDLVEDVVAICEPAPSGSSNQSTASWNNDNNFVANIALDTVDEQSNIASDNSQTDFENLIDPEYFNYMLTKTIDAIFKAPELDNDESSKTYELLEDTRSDQNRDSRIDDEITEILSPGTKGISPDTENQTWGLLSELDSEKVQSSLSLLSGKNEIMEILPDTKEVTEEISPESENESAETLQETDNEKWEMPTDELNNDIIELSTPDLQNESLGIKSKLNISDETPAGEISEVLAIRDSETSEINIGIEPETDQKPKDSGSVSDSTDQLNHALENLEQHDIEQTGNINDMEMNTIFSEDSFDDKNKKVKFSKVDLPVIFKKPIFESRILSADNIIEGRFKGSWYASSDFKIGIVFAEPNTHLLSNADESWPDDLHAPVLKPSASVSKSVSSLGRILEIEEKLTTTPEQESQSDIAEIKIKENENSKTSVSTCQSKDGLTQDEDNFDKKSHESATNQYLKSVIDDDFAKNADSCFNDFKLTIDEKQEEPVVPKIKHEWIVHPDTAPSWVFYGCGGEKETLKPLTAAGDIHDIRNWCKDLDQGYKNLKEWMNWIDDTCKNVLVLVQGKRKCTCSTIKQKKTWPKLTENIKKDAIMWKTVYQNNKGRLKRYNCNRQ